jgi:phage N-6-adenine-methyltransferase
MTLVKAKNFDALASKGFSPAAIAQLREQWEVTPAIVPTFGTVIDEPKPVAGEILPVLGTTYLIEEAKRLRAIIRQREKTINAEQRYLTADKWLYGQILSRIKATCKHGDWEPALKAIGENYQRADEAIKIGEHFKNEVEAGKCPVRKALKLIRKRTTPAEDTYATPDWLYGRLDNTYHFGLDAAACADNAKCSQFISPEQDALKQNWRKLSKGRAVFCNPPFCQIEVFVRSGWEQSNKGKGVVVVMIVPIWQSRDWFKEVVLKYGEVRFIGKKVIYQGTGTKAGSVSGWAHGSPAIMETLVAVFRKGQKALLGAPVVGSSRQDGTEAKAVA